MKAIKVSDVVGDFAEDKDKARTLRVKEIVPVLEEGHEVAVDFQGVTLATQSFIHALISEVIRAYGPSVLDRIVFQHCNTSIKGLIQFVAEYSQDTGGGENSAE